MIIEETRPNLKESDIARLHQTFFGSADTPEANDFLNHLATARDAVSSGSKISGTCDVPLNQIPATFKITPSLARECRQFGIGISYEGVDRQGYLSGADMERMCEDPNVCATDPERGNMVGGLSDMPDQAPITAVLGNTLTLELPGNKTVKIPVELSDRAKTDIAGRTPAAGAQQTAPTAMASRKP